MDVDVPPVAVAVLPVAVTTSVMLFPPVRLIGDKNIKKILIEDIEEY